MQEFLGSFTAGLFFTALTFVISALVTVAGKLVVKFVTDSLLFKKTTPPEPEPTVKKHKTKPKTCKSIEIDPDLIDRIYVRKTS